MTTTKEWDIFGRKVVVSGFDDAYLKGIGLYHRNDEAYCHLLRSLTPPSSTILDVGANIGKTVIQAACAQPGASIFAFEPGARNYDKLLDNISANSIENVIPVFAAVGDQNIGAVAFNDNSAWGGVIDGGPVTEKSPPCIRLDDYMERRGGDIRWIKIDVEGYEWEALRGMERLNKEFRPAVFLEFNMWTIIGVRNVRVMDFLGYLSETFRYCYRLHLKDGASQFNLESIDLRTVGGRNALVHDNIVIRRGLEDILLSNTPLV